MIEYIRSIPTEELLSWLQTDGTNKAEPPPFLLSKKGLAKRKGV